MPKKKYSDEFKADAVELHGTYPDTYYSQVAAGLGVWARLSASTTQGVIPGFVSWKLRLSAFLPASWESSPGDSPTFSATCFRPPIYACLSASPAPNAWWER